MLFNGLFEKLEKEMAAYTLIDTSKLTGNGKRLYTTRKNLFSLVKRASELIENRNPDTLSAVERLELVSIIKAAFHESGKIEGLFSVDSSAAGCEFCQTMQKIKGSICETCYAMGKREQMKEATQVRHKLNMIILSRVSFTVDELRTLGIYGATRINEDGDIVNVIHAENILRLTIAFRVYRFGFWYKNRFAVKQAYINFGADTKEKRKAMFPNVTMVLSSVMIDKPAEGDFTTDIVFTCYSSDELYLQAIASGAHPCNGKKCKACGFHCYQEGAAGSVAEKVRKV